MQFPIHKKFKYHNPFHSTTTGSFITLATAVCLYICVTNPMTWVKGFSVVSSPDLSPLISLSHSAKLAEASCKGKAKTVKPHPLFFHRTFVTIFWDIKGKTINGAVGCPTFLGRERKEKQSERWQIPMEATPSYWAAMLGGSRVSPNYSCLVTIWGRRWRSIRAGTINQKRLACSQGDCRVVLKAGTREGSITVWEHILSSPQKQDMQRPHVVSGTLF